MNKETTVKINEKTYKAMMGLLMSENISLEEFVDNAIWHFLGSQYNEKMDYDSNYINDFLTWKKARQYR